MRWIFWIILLARKIIDHVRENLEYELIGGWNTAPVVLKRGTGSCSEYTFSFITLCRAAGTVENEIEPGAGLALKWTFAVDNLHRASFGTILRGTNLITISEPSL